MAAPNADLSVIVYVPGKSPRRLPLDGELRVGSHPDNTLCLPEKGVLPRHFEIVPDATGHRVRALQPTADLRVNGQPAAERAVAPGDVIETGSVRFLVEARKVSERLRRTERKARFLLFSSGEMYIIDVGDRTTIGRGPGNHVTLADNLISRRHCAIERKGTRYDIRDLGSRNGTKVNGVTIQQTELHSGDMVDVGRCTLFFTFEEVAADETPAPARGTSISGPYLSSSSEMNIKLSSVVGIDNLATLIKDRNNLIRLQEITKAVNSELKLDKLFRLIIDSAIELTEANKGLLLKAQRQGFAVRMARAGGRLDLEEEEQTFSEDIARQAADSGRTVRVGAEKPDLRDRDPSATSLMAGYSVLCVPLKIQDEVFSLLYLDMPPGTGGFGEEDEKLLETFGEQAAMAVERARFHEEMKEKHALEHEFAIAGKIQRKLFPHRIPSMPGLEVFGENLPAQEVGGDYYDFIETPDSSSLFVCIGDVSGKGVSAGLIMVMARSILRSLAGQYTSTRDILAQLNRILMPDLEGGRFISMILLRWDVAERKLFYTGAGHEYLLLYRAAARRVERKRTGGIIIGMPWDGATQPIEEEEIPLGPGDQVIVYTDGVTEAPNPRRSFFGVRRLDKLVETYGTLAPSALVYQVLEKVSDYMQKEKQRDDITLLALRRTED